MVTDDGQCIQALDYADNEDCTFELLSRDDNTPVIVTPTIFELEYATTASGNDVCADYLMTDYTTLRCKSFPASFTLDHGSKIKFHSDYSVSKPGFRLCIVSSEEQSCNALTCPSNTECGLNAISNELTCVPCKEGNYRQNPTASSRCEICPVTTVYYNNNCTPCDELPLSIESSSWSCKGRHFRTPLTNVYNSAFNVPHLKSNLWNDPSFHHCFFEGISCDREAQPIMLKAWGGAWYANGINLSTLSDVDREVTASTFLHASLATPPLSLTLEDVMLSDCRINGDLLNFSAMTNLKYLNLRYNSITGTIKPLPASIIMVKFQGNLLHGDLPSHFSSLTNLWVLYVHRNELNGTVSNVNWSLLTNLEYMSLANNKLNGDLDLSFFNNSKWFPNFCRECSISMNEITNDVLDFQPVFEQHYRTSGKRSAIDIRKNNITNKPSPSMVRDCYEIKSRLEFEDIECFIAPNPHLCESGKRYLAGCHDCPFLEQCVTGGCSNGYNGYLCTTCPPKSYSIGGSCIHCGDKLSLDGVGSFVGGVSAISMVVAIFLLLNKKYFHLKFELNLRNLIRLKQISVLFQLTSMLFTFAVIPFPPWLRKFATVLTSISFPLKVEAPCLDIFSALMKYQMGILTIFLFAIISGGLVFVNRLPFIGKYINHSTHVYLQTIAGFVVTSSIMISASASCDLLVSVTKAMSVIIDGKYDYINSFELLESENLLHLINDDGVRQRLLQEFIFFTVYDWVSQAFLLVLIATGAEMLIQKASREYTIARNHYIETGDLTRVVYLPFWASFCMVYTTRSVNFESIVLRRKLLTFLVPSVIGSLYYCTIGAAETAFNLHSLLGLPKSLFYGVENMSALPIGAAALQSISLICLQIWYIGELVKRPFVSPRASDAVGDPINDAEILTTRSLNWCSTLFIFIVFSKQEKMDEIYITWTVVVVIMILIYPQHKLFHGSFRNALDRLRAGRSATSTGSTRSVGSQKTLNSRNSALGENPSLIIEELVNCDDPYECLRLNKALMLSAELTDAERLRWLGETKKEKKERVVVGGRGKVFKAVRVVLVVFFALFAYVVSSWLLLIVCSTTPGFEYVLVAAAFGLAIMSEVLRARWQKKGEIEAVKFKFTKAVRRFSKMNNGNGDGDGGGDGDCGGDDIFGVRDSVEMIPQRDGRASSGLYI